jgi:hypothetical protein
MLTNIVGIKSLAMRIVALQRRAEAVQEGALDVDYNKAKREAG